MYIHQHKHWPDFIMDAQAILPSLARVRHAQGMLVGRLSSLGFETRNQAFLEALSASALTTAAIEGEHFNAHSVRSSVAKRLGLKTIEQSPADRHIEGVVDILLDATQQADLPLTQKRLFAWHAALFPTGYSGLTRIAVAKWRPLDHDTMRVISGRGGFEHVHFEAPESKRLPAETKRFLEWANAKDGVDSVLKAAIAHLWFVTLHPFDDGNGRIARAIADLFLTRADGLPQRFYSMSAQILKERKAYYTILEQTQRGTMEITPWILWFLECLDQSIHASDRLLMQILQKAEFWRVHQHTPLNQRQRQMLNRLWDGFEGHLTSSKWAKMTKVSQDTAARDIQDLTRKQILHAEAAGGRSTRYALSAIKAVSVSQCQ